MGEKEENKFGFKTVPLVMLGFAIFGEVLIRLLGDEDEERSFWERLLDD